GKNSGNVDIKNLYMNIEGNIDDEYKKIPIGNVQSGSSKNQDFSIICKELGSQTLKIGFTYQDEYGNEYTVEPRNYNVDVINDGNSEESGKGISGLLKSISESREQIYITACAVIAILVLIVLYNRIKRKGMQSQY
nr:hypothetical protein [Lachnospiraceae bacterium]